MRPLVFLAALVFLVPVVVRGEAAPRKKLALIRQIPHSGYSEGLDWRGGFLWQTTPQETLKINPADGTVLERHPPASPYNESLVWSGDKIVIFSYHDNGIYTGTRKGQEFAFQRVGSTPEKHAWGSAFDGKHLVITGDHASKNLYFLDPKTFKVVRTLATLVPDLEDLAWDGQGLWTSSFTRYRGCIFRIDPKTGAMGSLWELPEPQQCPIIDGLAFDGKSLWITGKNCPAIYNVKVPAERAFSSVSKK